MAQCVARQYRLLTIGFLVFLEKLNAHSQRVFCLLVSPNSLAFSLQIALHFHCKYCVQNGLVFGVQVMPHSKKKCLVFFPKMRKTGQKYSS